MASSSDGLVNLEVFFVGFLLTLGPGKAPVTGRGTRIADEAERFDPPVPEEVIDGPELREGAGARCAAPRKLGAWEIIPGASGPEYEAAVPVAGSGSGAGGGKPSSYRSSDKAACMLAW